MREVWAEINGTIIGLDDISVENEGELYIWECLLENHRENW
jgi:hypothetical protein